MAQSIDHSLILSYYLGEIEEGGKEMRTFNYSAIKEQKWDSDVLGLIAAIYKEAGKQELYLKQRPEELEKLVEIAKIEGALRKLVAAGELKKEGKGKNTCYFRLN